MPESLLIRSNEDQGLCGMEGELLHEDGTGRAVAYQELESCRRLQLQNCIGENAVNCSALATKENAVSDSSAPWKQNSGLYFISLTYASY